MPEIRSPEDSIFPRPGEGIKTTQMYGIMVPVYPPSIRPRPDDAAKNTSTSTFTMD
jgi:hypothetical protein